MRAIAVAMSFSAFATTAVAQWGATTTIALGGNAFAPPPRIAVDAQGNPTVVFASSLAIVAVSGSSNGTWPLAEQIGVFDRQIGNAVGLAVSPSGKALAAWVEGGRIVTATRPLGGTWTGTAAGGPGTWPIVAGTTINQVLVGIDSQGRGVVAWEAQGQSTGVEMVVEAAAGWPANPETVPILGLGHGSLHRGDDGSVFLTADTGTVKVVRRDPTGGFTENDPDIGGRIEGVVGDAASDLVVGTLYQQNEILIQKAKISTNGSGPTVVHTEAATRPGLQGGSNAGGAGLRVASGEVTGAWLRPTANGRELRTATEIGATVDVVTLNPPTSNPTSAAVARTSGDDSVVVYTDSGGSFGVGAYTRSPCAAGQWDVGRTLDSGANYGAVGAAAGGNVAVGVWVQTNGAVRAAVFAGTAFASGDPCGSTPPPTLPPPPTCFGAAAIPNFGSSNLTVLDVDGGTTLGTVPLGSGPYGVAVHPIDDSVWVTNRESHTVSVLRGSALSATIPVGNKPLGIAFDPSGARAFVANYDPDTVTIIDTASRAVDGDPVPVGSGPSGLAVGGGGTRVWTANYAANTISLIDVSTKPPTVRTSGPIIFRPLAIAESPDGKQVIVTGYKSNRAVVIDVARLRVVKRLIVGKQPTGVAFQPLPATRAFVASSKAGSVAVIDTSTNRVVGQIPTGRLPYGVSVDPTGKLLFVVESGDGRVLVWDLVANALKGRFAVGQLPVGLGNFLLHNPICP